MAKQPGPHERPPPPIKTHGGKHYLADRIVRLMPPHTHYVEPFAGGLSVLLAKDPTGTSEVVSDLNAELMAFWAVMRDPVLFERFRREVEAVPFSEPAFEHALGVLEEYRTWNAPVQGATT